MVFIVREILSKVLYFKGVHHNCLRNSRCISAKLQTFVKRWHWLHYSCEFTTFNFIPLRRTIHSLLITTKKKDYPNVLKNSQSQTKILSCTQKSIFYVEFKRHVQYLSTTLVVCHQLVMRHQLNNDQQYHFTFFPLYQQLNSSTLCCQCFREVFESHVSDDPVRNCWHARSSYRLVK